MLDKSVMQRFGDAVKRLRARKDMSQEELAAAAELSRATIQKIEEAAEDNLQGKTRRQLAKALCISTDQLRHEWQGETRAVELPADLIDLIESHAAIEGKSVAELLRELVGPKGTPSEEKSRGADKLNMKRTNKKSSPSSTGRDGSTSHASH